MGQLPNFSRIKNSGNLVNRRLIFYKNKATIRYNSQSTGHIEPRKLFYYSLPCEFL